ncbi:type II toxin-antitoxin system RelE/ParE family toxin [Xylella fastidiosa]|uniref:Type II toxin-antitoxin system mRNA interferase toxin, RelE/StbE family n=1 Tax=Xylella fastidiosa subsp. fastidiosa TaxID=644356 RepID=A0AAJ5R201_XYLFS|nr:type II toxin-antitoxin system mRNA interferase toxin, RelE/StbE family [Xylella fastidiosa]MDD0929928.1 type II toxin-antitoxin system mRNA interferase toxin, RelE/StbE family [Xylella fastidiosa subsp. multiplex]MDD0943164.1 type II toxin-antitoxin system mRNA interferase toxin, RelE/StbE family [Xylella fastidiosa subsp. multiplex]UIT40613.1 type II toxin-antitoxin system mRNA interferase toxin, RelE/StbE family [Xylella fastidiosa subsp. multiplex]WCF29114.1 type II toxin-antitoxin syste
MPLEPRHRDHALVGNWKDLRDCHIKPDLVLIYTRVDSKTLTLVRLGSHVELKRTFVVVDAKARQRFVIAHVAIAP